MVMFGMDHLMNLLLTLLIILFIALLNQSIRLMKGSKFSNKSYGSRVGGGRPW